MHFKIGGIFYIAKHVNLIILLYLVIQLQNTQTLPIFCFLTDFFVKEMLIVKFIGTLSPLKKWTFTYFI